MRQKKEKEEENQVTDDTGIKNEYGKQRMQE